MMYDWDWAYAPTGLFDGSFIWWKPSVERLVKTFTKLKRFRHIVLYGPPGTGKSTILDLLPEEILDGKTRNAIHRFDARSNTQVTENYKRIVDLRKTTHQLDGDRIIVCVNEVDNFREQRLDFMKNLLDNFSRKVPTLWPIQLIVTTNDLDKIPTAVRQRMCQIPMEKPSHEQLVEHGERVLTRAGVTLPKEVIDDCVLWADRSPRLFMMKLGEEAMMEMV